MFEFLKDIYQDKSMTLKELNDAVITYNSQMSRNDKIRIADLSKGDYVTVRKYLAKRNLLKERSEELTLKKRKCMEMRVRILILEQRLQAYEYLMTKEDCKLSR